MTSQSPRIYLYKITFEEVPYYYYGSKKERYFGEEYWGSPVANKWCWELYTPKKQILEFFDYNDEGWLKAQEVEKRLIRPFLNDPYCLNENCGGKISLRTARKTGKRTYELGLGVHARTKEQKSEDGRKGGNRNKELGVGIFSLTKEQLIENGRKYGSIAGKAAAKKHKENGTGLYSFTKEEKSESGKKGGKITQELCIGIFSLTKEQLSEQGKRGAKITLSQKWMCLETGFIGNPGNVTLYQRARGIDTSKRIRLS